MKLGLRILIGFLLIFGAAIYALTHDFLGTVRTRYLEGVEEVLVDQSRVLAGFVSAEMARGEGYPQRLQALFRGVYGQNFSARIYRLVKTTVDTRVYVTDEKGVLVFDSKDPQLVGADYSAWRDVLLTLEGEYGARTSHEDPLNPHASTLYVAAPIVHKGRVTGVLSVGKPTHNINLFLHMARRQITERSVIAAICVVSASTVFMFFILRPIRRLIDYAHRVRQGKKATLPPLGSSELGDMGRALEQMRLALEDKAYVERYVQTLTHEIKSPVSAIAGAAELLEEQMAPEQRARFLANIRKESDRIRQLVDRLLALAAVEGMQALKRREPVKLDELVAAVTDEFRPLAANRSIALDTKVADVPAVTGDALLLRQAVANLVQNALDFSPPAGRIEIALQTDGRFVTLTVSDRGPGIPDFAQTRIFEKFFSLRRPESGEKSTGLGLNFVRETAELHGGEVVLENRTGGGARARLRLPG